MLIRLMFTFRAALNYVHTMDLHSHYMCKHFGFKPTLNYTFKAIVKYHPGRLMVYLTFTSFFALSYLLRLAEYPYWYATGQLDFQGLTICIWTVVVGYGDFNPGTDFGRVIMVISKIWEGALLGLLVVVTERALALTSKEA